MTSKEFKDLVESIDSKNAEYIMNSSRITNVVSRINRWCNDKTEKSERIVSMLVDELKQDIIEFDKLYLTPANAKVGDGATVNLYTDRHAGTIVKVTKTSITIRRDKATLSPDFKPDFIPGGFSVHCTNQDEQSWTYEPDPNGELTTIYWSKVYNQYGRPGNLTASKGRHEFYDYNF